MALPILMNDGPILIERQLRRGSFADLPAIALNNFLNGEKYWTCWRYEGAAGDEITQ
jgi:hypothetical protein